VTIVTSTYRPKRAPRKKRKQPAIVSRIVTPPKLKPLKGPVIRLHEHQANDSGQEQPKRSAIVEPKRKRASLFGNADLTEEELQRGRDAAEALFREVVRRAAEAKKERP
jgi:hypothetical protein